MRSSVLAALALAVLPLLGATRAHASGKEGEAKPSTQAATSQGEQPLSTTPEPADLVRCELGSPPPKMTPPRYPPGEPSAPVAYPFCENWNATLPKKISGREPKFTAQALAAGESGLGIARCTLTKEGVVKSCILIKALPHMEQEVLDVLHGSRYSPVMCEGKPVEASYVFTLRLRHPGSEAGTKKP
jgi:hypothetical protein